MKRSTANLRLTVLYVKVITLPYIVLRTIKRGGVSGINGLIQTPTTIACLGISSLLTVNIIIGAISSTHRLLCYQVVYTTARRYYPSFQTNKSQTYSQTAYVDKAKCSDYLVDLSISFEDANCHAIFVGMEAQSNILGADLLLGISELKKLDISVVVFGDKERYVCYKSR